MNDDVLQSHRIEPIIEDEFVPDPALDPLYRQAVVVARGFGWTVPSHEDFESRYKAEIAASKRNEQ